MAEDDKDKVASIATLEASIGPANAKASFTDFFFGRLKAKNRIQLGVADAIAEKINKGEALTPGQRFFFAHVFEKELKRAERAEAVLARAVELFPVMEQQMKGLLPAPSDPADSSEEFFARVSRDAEDVSDENVRERYARILAGEVARPGSFSLMTLSVLRDLERETALIFEKAVQLLIGGAYLPDYAAAEELYTRCALDFDSLITLREAGLLLDTGITGDVRCKPLHHHGYLLRVRFAWNDGIRSRDVSDSARFPALALTKAGRELAMLPSKRLDLSIIRGLAEYLLAGLGFDWSQWRDPDFDRPGRQVAVTWCDGGGVERDFDPPLQV
jgi:hypothetical protein